MVPTAAFFLPPPLYQQLRARSKNHRAIQTLHTGHRRTHAMRNTVTGIEDILPHTAANYWYWIPLQRRPV